MYIYFTLRTLYSCPILIKLDFSRHILEEYSNIKFLENPSSGSLVFLANRRTDMVKQIVASRNFETAPKNEHLVRQRLIAGYRIAR